MNYKLLLPTYRNRYLFVKETLTQQGHFKKVLNLGCGEGDYDPMIAPFCEELIACDINEADVAFARKLNCSIPNLEYRVENALDLTFADHTFDAIISIDVLEHVGQPQRMMAEIQRVLKPNGVAILSFPSSTFPMTYDPLNTLLQRFFNKKIPMGAYAFGHEYLISPNGFRAWSLKNNLQISREKNLSGYLVAFLEMYWSGILQSLFKANAKNVTTTNTSKIVMRPGTDEPKATTLIDALLRLDDALFKNAKHSVGKGFLLKKVKVSNDSDTVDASTCSTKNSFSASTLS